MVKHGHPRRSELGEARAVEEQDQVQHTLEDKRVGALPAQVLPTPFRLGRVHAVCWQKLELGRSEQTHIHKAAHRRCIGRVADHALAGDGFGGRAKPSGGEAA